MAVLTYAGKKPPNELINYLAYVNLLKSRFPRTVYRVPHRYIPYYVYIYIYIVLSSKNTANRCVPTVFEVFFGEIRTFKKRKPFCA